MPLRPFSLPLSIGTDICQISRIHALISKTRGSSQPSSLAHFMNRLLTHREQNDFRSKFDSASTIADQKLETVATHLAGRWAAKEAAIKAVRHRRLSFMDVEILRYRAMGGSGGVFALIRDESGSPKDSSSDGCTNSAEPDATSKPLEQVYGELEGQIARISISHDGDYATAVCMTVDEPMAGDVGGEAAARIP